MIELHEVLIKICYIPESWVKFAPPEGHPVNVLLCEELNIDPVVISLIKRIPYIEEKDPINETYLYPISRPFYYLLDDELRQGRDPELADTGEDLSLNYLLPQDVAFTCGPRDGEAIVLDTKENTIGRIQLNGPECSPGSVLERPDEPFHYRNSRTYHAPTFLQQYVDSIKNLDLLPVVCHQRDFVPKDSYEGAKMRKVLMETYGWPHEFRHDDWKNDMQQLWIIAIKESIRDYAEGMEKSLMNLR
ncbi:hypothetical protein F5884DRAFT_731129 [Xylogone sp. PMI_703]|nr:hypothetical protein F5884DRAFT_731129 [Xylogone sp. PMI_703]